MFCYLKCIVYGKLLKPRQSFRITLYCYLLKNMPTVVIGFRTAANQNRGKEAPLQAWSGPEGSRKLRFQDFMTTAQDGGKVVSLTHRPPLPPGNAPGTHFC